MTDARFPERWLMDKRIIGLSNSAFRTFVLGMTFSVANRLDGYVERDDLTIVHGADPSDVPELIKSGLWSEADDVGIWIEGFTKVQTSAAQLEGLEHKKQQDAHRAKRYRDKKKDSDPDPNPPSSRDSSRDDIGQDRTGRTGQALSTGEVVHESKNDNSPPPSSSEPCFGCGAEEPMSRTSFDSCSECPTNLTAPAVSLVEVKPSCAAGGCPEPARPGRQMCQLHYTKEPALTPSIKEIA